MSKTGNWRGTRKFFQVLATSRIVDKFLDEAAEKEAQIIARRMRKIIRSGLNPPLEAETIERKERYGSANPSLPLFYTGALYRSINVIKVRGGNYWAGVRSVTPRPSVADASHYGYRGYTTDLVALWHEYGTNRIPERSFIRRAYRETVKDRQKSLEKGWEQMVGDLKSKYGIR